MEFRHFFNNDKMDYFYMNFLRPFGYISLLYPSEKIRLLIERSEYTYLRLFWVKVINSSLITISII